MAEETQTPPAEVATETVTYTPIEQKAMEEGWVPETEWQGEADQWRPAKEFLDRGELIKKIESSNRTIKDMKRAIEDMRHLQAKTRDIEYARALNSLKAEKKRALEENDADTVVQIDEDIDLLKTEQRKLEQAPPQDDEPNPTFVAWVDKNKWYSTDVGMRGFADSYGRSLGAKGLSPEQVLVEVEKEVRKEFPHKFTNPNRQKPGAVESSVKSGKSTDTYVLSDIERQVMHRFIRTGAMKSEKEYIDSLKNIKEV